MPAEVLIDTNVLVYAYDLDEPEKRARARGTLARIVDAGLGRLSVQVLGEFVSTVTRKLKRPLPLGEAATQVDLLARTWPVLPVTPIIVFEALRGARDHRLNYWDAQVWATARLNQIGLVLSEDFSDGRTLEGVTFQNPFTRTFDLTRFI